jgi:hypothetical protein
VKFLVKCANQYLLTCIPATLAPIGNAELQFQMGARRADGSLPLLQGVQNLANPRWSAGEAVWRVLNVLRTVQAQSMTSQTPIAAFLGQQGTTGLDLALFPNDVRSLLIANEQVITSSSEPWVGRNNPAGAETPPFAGVQVAHAGPSGLRQVVAVILFMR